MTTKNATQAARDLTTALRNVAAAFQQFGAAQQDSKRRESTAEALRFARRLNASRVRQAAK